MTFSATASPSLVLGEGARFIGPASCESILIAGNHVHIEDVRIGAQPARSGDEAPA